MPEHAAFAVATLVGAILLAIREKERVLPGIALAASALLVLMAYDWIWVTIRGINLPIILWGVVAIVGILSYFKVDTKVSVASASILAVLAGLQCFGSIRVG